MQGELAYEEGQHAEDHEQAHRCDIALAVAREVLAGNPAWYQQVAQGAEHASVEVPEGFEEFLDGMAGVADRVVHRLSAAVAELALQDRVAVLALAGMPGVGIGGLLHRWTAPGAVIGKPLR